MAKSALIILLIALSIPLHSQQYTLYLSAPENKIIGQWQRTQPPVQDSLAWIMARNALLNALHLEGYLLAEIPEWKYSGDTLHATIHAGQPVYWAALSFRGLEFLPPQWVSELDVSGKRVDYPQWKSTIMNVLRKAQSEGYLFAEYKLDIIDLKNDSLRAEVFFNPGLRIILDTIEVEGTARLSDRFLQNTIGLKPGQPVSPEDLRYLQQQIQNLRFVQQTHPPVLILNAEKATIRTYLQNRNASSFDILVGLQPSTDPASALSLIGYVELDLINQLTRGERMYLHIERLRPRSQELEIKTSYPYLLELPFGVEGEFSLLKNDTLFSDLVWKAGIAMPLGQNQSIRAGLTQQATNIIGIDRNRIISTKRLPSYVDMRVNGFVLGLNRNRLDYDLNPRKGYSLVVEGSFSQKRIRENNAILDLNAVDSTFDYSTLYDSLRASSSRVALTGVLQYFVPWGDRSTIRLSVDAGAMKSGDRIFSNELFRLGGYARLRGFDEQSVLAQFFSIFTAEYRLLMGGGSFISLFTDYAWVRNEDVELPLEDRPFALGLGLNLETKAGIFGMRAAVGSQRNRPLDIDDTRLHFGYVNRF